MVSHGDPRHGHGFSYNVGKSLSALSIAAVGMLATRYGLSATIGGFCLVAYLIVILAVLALPETKASALDEPPGQEGADHGAASATSIVSPKEV